MFTTQLLVTMLLPLTFLGSTPAMPAARESRLQSDLAKVAARCDGKAGIVVVDLSTGETAAVDPASRYPMASVFKLVVAVAALRRVQDGQLRLTDPIEFGPDDYNPGYSPFRDSTNRSATTITVEKAIEWMIVESDNSTVDVLMRKLGGPRAVTAELEKLGLHGIDVSREESQMAADESGLGDAPGGHWGFASLTAALERAGKLDEAKARARMLADERDTSTPAAMAELLARLGRGELLDAERTAVLVSMMERCATGKKRLPAGLPAGGKVGHKTGTWPTLGVYNDVGLVTRPDGRRYAVVVFVKESKSDAVAERTIADVARAIGRSE
jgi:beta-lactamase class A